ncbi:DarT ssDNA thymidine ADP-ribosyltransferase family protein [Adhaeribacter soli]|uniref:DUF4433 domain-containing protein n=1 Tax=Adhaeribacter soli TaxID=2607655 RepID=A0A5N1IS00_9BACT|nr:DarT ssDNA thymidine ADP-ribosyltransferase family protein [Adhaeribacter soli]KAA9332691.1 DUF4433 domain-containing protein [Adhaeribacter soli]
MDNKTDFDHFERQISSKGIEYLVHFTPTINLLSILENGFLYSRAYLEQLDIYQTDILDFVEFTDKVRYDDKNYINLSLSFPNYFLFNKFRERTSDQPHIQWCVLKINPKYIYQKETLFAVTNAASNCAKKQYGISGDLRKFEQLFQDNLTINSFSGSRIASRGNLKAKYPTDVQAEILVKDMIKYDDVLEVCFKDAKDLASAKAALGYLGTEKFVIDESLFTSQRN